MDSSPTVGSVLIGGGVRLPSAEESALNLLLRKYGGEEDGMQLYKLGWALEDNHSTWNETDKKYDFDPLKLPICLHETQASYHLLSWEPPTTSMFAVERIMQQEGAPNPMGDTSKGQYNCLFHFLDDVGRPMRPTTNLMEIILPMLRQLNEIALAARKGFNATLKQKRNEKIDQIKAKEAAAQSRYASYADDLLAEKAPAFEGNPTSFPGVKTQSFSDLMPGERRTETADDGGGSPLEFVFTSHAPKGKK